MHQIDHYDDINTLDEANTAVFDNDMAIRIQPRAPAATKYYYIDNGWKQQKAGRGAARDVDVETVRRVVSDHIPKNDRMDGGGVKAVDKEELY